MSLAALASVILCALIAIVAGGAQLHHHIHHYHAPASDGKIVITSQRPPPRKSSSSGGDDVRRGGAWRLLLLFLRRRPSLVLSPSSRRSYRSLSMSSHPVLVVRRADIILSRVRGGSAEEEEEEEEEEVDDDADDDATVVIVDGDIPDADDDAMVASVIDDVDVVANSSSTSFTSDDDDALGGVPSRDTRRSIPNDLAFSATKPHDGSLDDPDGIPTRFLLMKKNDRVEARVAFESTLAWRREHDVDTVLSRPHPKFDVCKAALPHYFPGRDPHGNVILVQRPAALDFELMSRNNSTIDDLLMHYIYVIEYCWNILEPGPPDRGMTNVLDMRGMTFGIVRNQEYIGFGKRFVQMMSENYPGRSYKTLVINAPKWFHALYKIFKPVLRESTRQKIVILKAGEQQDAALRFYLGDSLPRDIMISDGGKGGGGGVVAGEEMTSTGVRYFLPVEKEVDCEPGPNSLFEFEMRQFVS
ncbi:hypothetical protein ACHAXA_004908 [Cyclostephanos tholiformis]|uniref:CRAL-TRIO domain-containing protein n=1 Tax=Cyclostephanos tholiformis TaxID=382380 RepID=A0ABD3RX53_9STRA